MMNDADSRSECASYTYSDDEFEQMSPTVSPTVSLSKSSAFLLPESGTELTTTDLSSVAKTCGENSSGGATTAAKSEGDIEGDQGDRAEPTTHEETTVSDDYKSEFKDDEDLLPASSTVSGEEATPPPPAQSSALTHEHDCTTAKQV